MSVSTQILEKVIHHPQEIENDLLVLEKRDYNSDLQRRSILTRLARSLVEMNPSYKIDNLVRHLGFVSDDKLRDYVEELI
jgi:hypothetical protein